ncbi:hypothetical protein WK80_30410 [Burkholderia multivorans]|uniref:hypothetical protein n=1 Tax=Burkholderia multivorans TaxID=87883 RepID=UPI00075AA8A0|nr:hypothetical protein [Burkholderia multivorans]KVV17036.1 hypothetical protein WK80_30410 [Burkholderia multivorans]MBU9200524.1 hypothetical protein [Burkholderia multivorans]MCA8387730.1 hypothetical protein [Burkholderia multivorans]MCO8319308.1 hypothetical protein [Burkholderia multivorans]MCO8352771.1 hypothetical protein [Burkholderia multivorans]
MLTIIAAVIRRATERKRWIAFAVPMLACFVADHAYAKVELAELNISNRYHSCSWTDNGNGTSTLRVSIDFKSIDGVTLGRPFLSRGVLVYAYDKNGRMLESSDIAQAVYMGSVRHSVLVPGRGYVMYHGYKLGSGLNPPPFSDWGLVGAFTARVTVIVDNAKIEHWPALSIRAGNYLSSNDVAEIKGAAYLARYGGSGSCNLVNPVTPPEPPRSVAIDVTAPNWDLGELPRGEGKKSFSSIDDALCFKYSASAVNGKRFVIDATSAAGTINGRYRLKNGTDTIPYTVELSNGAVNIPLPNMGGMTVPLDSTGRSCWMPTFTTDVPADAKVGQYHDVLTFTVVTKT